MHKIPKFLAKVHNETDGQVVELCVFSEIGETWDGTGTTARMVKEALDSAGPYGKIRLRINSPGGDAFEGIAIHSLLKASGKPIETCVDGVAASAASIVAMAGETITMARSAVIMIHAASTLAMGNAADLRKAADMLDKVSDSIATVYHDKTGIALNRVKEMMDAETWLSAEECVEQGFATNIAGDDTKEAVDMARNAFKAVLAKYKNTPQAMKADEAQFLETRKFTKEEIVNVGMGTTNPQEKLQVAASTCPCNCTDCVAGDCSKCTNESCTSDACKDCPQQQDVDDSVADDSVADDLSLFEAIARLHQLTR